MEEALLLLLLRIDQQINQRIDPRKHLICFTPLKESTIHLKLLMFYVFIRCATKREDQLVMRIQTDWGFSNIFSTGLLVQIVQKGTWESQNKNL